MRLRRVAFSRRGLRKRRRCIRAAAAAAAGGEGETADKGRRHLHSPSVATLAGLQREVDAGAAGEG